MGLRLSEAGGGDRTRVLCVGNAALLPLSYTRTLEG